MGLPWRGQQLVAREIGASTYAYPMVFEEGTTRETCIVLAHGNKHQGDDTLCPGCRVRAGCTQRLDYSKRVRGFATRQGHVAPCETQVLAQLKSSFPDGVFDPDYCNIGWGCCPASTPFPAVSPPRSSEGRPSPTRRSGRTGHVGGPGRVHPRDSVGYAFQGVLSLSRLGLLRSTALSPWLPRDGL